MSKNKKLTSKMKGMKNFKGQKQKINKLGAMAKQYNELIKIVTTTNY